jgi:outer membrane immunogenic protein
MKKYVGAAIAIAVISGSSAHAASIGGWSGFYIGGNAGLGWHDRTAAFMPNDAATIGEFPSTFPAPLSGAGALGGAQAGYNWQFNARWLAGLEADFDFASINGAPAAVFLSDGDGPFTSSAASQLKWFGTVRGRLGYLPAENLLIYATGGLAYGRVEDSATILNSTPGAFAAAGPGIQFGFLCGAAGSACFAGSASSTRVGWTAGAGFEFLLPRGFSIKTEYLYVNLGAHSFTLNGMPLPGDHPSSVVVRTNTDAHIVRLGLNYRFDN